MMTSTTGKDMLALMPPSFAGENVEALLDAAGLALDALILLIYFVIDQLFVVSASGWGLDRWENELGLESYAGKPDDQRRSRIMSKIRGMGTVNALLIKKVAESYHNGTVAVMDHPDLYSFIIKFIDTMGVPPNLEDLNEAIQEIKPAHLAAYYEYQYLLIRNIHETMTIAQMQSHQLQDFAPFALS